MPGIQFGSTYPSNNLRIVGGMHTTVAASDTINTTLQKVLFAVAQLEDAPLLTVDRVLAFVGDQAGTPPAGRILIRTYRPTSATDPTPTQTGLVFGKKISWFAVGY